MSEKDARCDRHVGEVFPPRCSDCERAGAAERIDDRNVYRVLRGLVTAAESPTLAVAYMRGILAEQPNDRERFRVLSLLIGATVVVVHQVAADPAMRPRVDELLARLADDDGASR